MLRPLFLCAGILLTLPGAVRGQQCAEGTGLDAVARIEIHRHNVFDSTEQAWWQRLGNALHRTTSPDVIRSELLLEPCLPFDSALAAESARNLRALGTFRRVEIDTLRSGSRLVVRVTTRDGWSTRPELTFNSTGDQAEFTLGLVEQNLLGRAALLGARYAEGPDRASRSLWFAQRRAFGAVGLELAGEDRSDGWNGSVALNRPFFAYATPAAGSISFYTTDGDVRRYRGGDPVPAAVLRRRLTVGRLSLGRAIRAAPDGYLRLLGSAQIVRDGFAPSPEMVERRTTAAVGLAAELSRARFVELTHFRSLGRPEDVDLSPTLRLGLQAAPAFLGYSRGGVGLEVAARGGVPLGRGFLMAELAANGLHAAGAVDSGRVVASATLLLRPAARLALIAHGERGWQKDPAPGEEFDLGLGRGLRAHRAHAFTGDRAAWVAAELRWDALEDALGLVDVGLAAFGARGGAWFDGEPRRTGGELGAGLRFGLSREADGVVGRVDLARRFATDRMAAGWTLVFGEGLPF